MTGDGSDVVGITQRELLLEMRSDLKTLKATVDMIAKDQALGVERRREHAAHGRRASTPASTEHDRELDDMRRWRDRADGAMVLARWALGASLLSLVAVAIQIVSNLAHTINPALP